MPEPIRVAVTGAAGRMGSEVVRAVNDADGLVLVAAVDHSHVGEDAGQRAGISATGVIVSPELSGVCADVLVDFTTPTVAKTKILSALDLGMRVVVGTTGLTDADLAEIEAKVTETGLGVLVAPNFAIGAVLMMEFAARAAKYLPDVEIIELHHEKKLDSPSGTAMMTARKIAAAREGNPVPIPDGLVEKIPGGRGANYEGVHIHSVRLPGHVAHQEVIFGGQGESLRIRHDSLDRRCFMPGVVLAVRRIMEINTLVVGLDKILFD